MEKRVILKSGKTALIRPARLEDAWQLIVLSRSVMEEDQYSTSDPDEFNISVEQEEMWISDHLVSSGKALFVAEVDEKVVGFINFVNGPRRRLAHRGEMGILVGKDWRDSGVGTLLTKTLLQWASENPIVEKVNLFVFANNPRAIHLYKKLGFVEEGYRKKEIKLGDGTYIDDILMGYWLGS